VYSADMSKEFKYRQLVGERKECNDCEMKGMVNPSRLPYDCYEINAWSQWQNSLSAKILLVGMDWGPVKHFKENRGKDPRDPTNVNIVELFKIIGHEISVSDGETYGKKDPDLFFTNAVLYLRERDEMQGNICQKIANICAKKFTKKLIEMIRPKVVIALGNVASEAIAACYNDDKHCVKLPKTMKEKVDDEKNRNGFKLNNDTVMFPVYHCGAWGRNRNRPFEAQKKDWDKIADYLRSSNTQLTPGFR